MLEKRDCVYKKPMCEEKKPYGFSFKISVMVLICANLFLLYCITFLFQDSLFNFPVLIILVCYYHI